jgi:hypothetical protein
MKTLHSFLLTSRIILSQRPDHTVNAGRFLNHGKARHLNQA